MQSNKPFPALLIGVVLGFLSAVASLAGGGPGFRTHHLLEEHYAKHGYQFGKVTLEQYLRLAQQLRDAKPGKFVMEAKRKGGSAKFDKRNGWFVAYDADGTIRTFFIPNDGVRYFERQARNYGAPE